MAECPKCGAELEEKLRAGDRCPECGYKHKPPRRDDDDDSDLEDRPRREEKKKKSGGAGKVLLILAIVGGIGLLGCCGGGYYIFKTVRTGQVEIVDISRQKSGEGGTQSVKVTIRVSATRAGNQVAADYAFYVKSGTRTSIHRVSLRGHGGGDYTTTISTPELSKEPGAPEFWVEQEGDGGGSDRVSKIVTIP